MSYLSLFSIKLIDNIILTAKSIATYKHRKILSSLLVAISQFLFYVVIKQIVNDGSMTAILVVCAASFIGNYLAFEISERLEKDDTWENVITSSDKELIIELCTMLKEHKVKYLLYDTYNRRLEKSLTVTAFTKTKAESKLIDEFLERTNSGYLRMINGEEKKNENKRL